VVVDENPQHCQKHSGCLESDLKIFFPQKPVSGGHGSPNVGPLTCEPGPTCQWLHNYVSGSWCVSGG
jgi:hypothetical protein